MTNNKLSKKLIQLLEVKNKYHDLLKEVEKEIEKRYGYYPSEIDNDDFIDSYHYQGGKAMTLKDLDNSMKESIQTKQKE
jgi:hypothetical protein